MFTGIIQSVGRLRARSARGVGQRLSIECAFDRYELGESIAVDGVCLTVVSFRADGFDADASAETLARSTLGARAVGQRVNLERALRVGDRLGGHIVAGHVDGVGHVRSITAVGEAQRWAFTAPAEVLRFVAEKGSITIDGVSLTVNAVQDDGFEVMLVPFTQQATTFADRASGSAVNLEADVLARYVARALASRTETAAPAGLTLDTLMKHGFVDR